MLPGLNGVYAYEDAALQTFLAARRLGIRTIYDLPIGYWREARRIYEEERELQPAWASTLTGLKDSPAKLARKDEELQLADQVIVPSRFVESTLLNHKACKAPVSVAPFGSPAPVSTLPESDNTSPLRVLFIGSLGQRKGLAYLLEAVHYLDTAVKLTLIGKITSLDCKPLAQALERHHWIETLPNSAILEQMRLHDVLVLPSLFEGYALVISEALSQGLPVIATPNSGATEAVRNGLEGFIVPIRSSESIAECLQQLFKDREKLYFMRQACLTRAAELSWNGYEQSIRQIVGNCLELGSARV
jgi:glycosyltransferase involved in cell wall biosynthesis